MAAARPAPARDLKRFARRLGSSRVRPLILELPAEGAAVAPHWQRSAYGGQIRLAPRKTAPIGRVRTPKRCSALRLMARVESWRPGSTTRMSWCAKTDRHL